MRKSLSILFLALIATVSFVSETLASKPTTSTYFDDVPWASTYANKYWLDESNGPEYKSHIVRQLFYTAYDRCVVVGLQMPWYEQQYTLACGWQTCKNLRAEGATNTLQLLRDVSLTDQVFTVQYCVAKDVQNTGKGFAMSNAPVAIDAHTFLALDQALEAVVGHYVPYTIYDSVTDYTNIPTYCNVGAVLYEYDEYQDLVTNIVWDDTDTYIVSCKWSWGTNSLPYPNGSDLSHSTQTSLVLLSALDARAKVITMLKYALYDGIPCAQGNIGNLKMTTGYGGAVGTETTEPEYGDYGRAGDTLGYAYLATSHDTAWATASPHYVTDGKDGQKDWNGVANVGASASSSTDNYDWPTSGWLGIFNYKVDVDLSRDSDPPYVDWYINGTVNPNVKWNEIGAGGWVAPDGVNTYTDTINGHYAGGAPYSISVNWDSESAITYQEFVPGYYYMAGSDETITTVTNTSPTTNVVSSYSIFYGWSNLVAGTSMGDKLYTYGILGNTFFEFTNDSPVAATEFINLCQLLYGYSITTKVDSVFTTNTVTIHHEPEPPGDWIPDHYDTRLSNDPAPVPTSGSWELTLDGDSDNYLEAAMVLYDSRPNIPIVITKLDKDHNLTSLKCYMIGLNGDTERPSFGVLEYPEWDDIGFADISPVPAGDGLTPDAVKLMGTGTYNSTFHMYYYSMVGGAGDPYGDYYTAGPVRIFWGVKQSWWIAEYNFPKRKTGDLPLPKSE